MLIRSRIFRGGRKRERRSEANFTLASFKFGKTVFQRAKVFAMNYEIFHLGDHWGDNFGETCEKRKLALSRNSLQGLIHLK